MTVLQIFRTLPRILPYIAMALATQNFMMAREAKLERLARVAEEKVRMLEIIKDKENIIIHTQTTQERIASLSCDASEHFS